jgi:flavin-dependent dehydrogenase
VLSSRAVQVLRGVGLERRLVDCGTPEAGMVDRWADEEPRWRASILSPWGPRWRVDRVRLDRALQREAVGLGATVGGALQRASSLRQGFDVHTGASRLTTRILVDATGASACVSRALGLKRWVLDRQAALFTESQDAVADFAIESRPRGWTYRMGRQLVLVTDPQGARHVARTSPARRWRATPVVSHAVDAGALRGFFAIGDAAWTPDPLSGQGVESALLAAIEAADHILQGSSRTRSPLELAVEHLRARATLFGRARWSERPFFTDRVRAWRAAQESLA